MDLSIIVPVLNEARVIEKSLKAIRLGAPQAEIIVVDGGSTDESVALAQKLCDKVLIGAKGRAIQMNLGAEHATGDVLAFVHADTIVPRDFACAIESALTDDCVVGGRFDVELDEDGFIYRIIATLINVRSRMSKVATGDQVLFVRKSVFEQLGGYRNIEICEDLDFSRRLKRIGKVACLKSRVVTSARRWKNQGVLRTIVLMWLIKLLFLSGVSPAFLARFYAAVR